MLVEITGILQDGWIFTIGEVGLGRVCSDRATPNSFHKVEQCVLFKGVDQRQDGHCELQRMELRLSRERVTSKKGFH